MANLVGLRSIVQSGPLVRDISKEEILEDQTATPMDELEKSKEVIHSKNFEKFRLLLQKLVPVLPNVEADRSNHAIEQPRNERQQPNIPANRRKNQSKSAKQPNNNVDVNKSWTRIFSIGYSLDEVDVARRPPLVNPITERRTVNFMPTTLSKNSGYCTNLSAFS